jgi:hypothetical protein
MAPRPAVAVARRDLLYFDPNMFHASVHPAGRHASRVGQYYSAVRQFSGGRGGCEPGLPPAQFGADVPGGKRTYQLIFGDTSDGP